MLLVRFQSHGQQYNQATHFGAIFLHIIHFHLSLSVSVLMPIFTGGPVLAPIISFVCTIWRP